MRNTLIIISALYTFTICAQDSLLTNQKQEKNNKQEIQIAQLEAKINALKTLPDKIEHSGQIEIQNPEAKPWFEYFFPSFIALFVGLIALFGTIYSGRKQRQSSEKQLKEQLAQGQASLIAQIQASKETIQNQIDSEKLVAELNFRQNVLSINRQNWINNLRDIISKVISMSRFIASKNSVTRNEFRELEELLIKAELLVNPKKDETFISALRTLKNTLLQILLTQKNYSDLSVPEDELLLLTKKTLKTEWERVKKGE